MVNGPGRSANSAWAGAVADVAHVGGAAAARSAACIQHSRQAQYRKVGSQFGAVAVANVAHAGAFAAAATAAAAEDADHLLYVWKKKAPLMSITE